MTRAIATVNVMIDKNSLGDMPMADYIERLEEAVRDMDGITEGTEITVRAGDVTRYKGLYADSEVWQYDALTDRLYQLAEDVFSAMCAGR